MFKNIHVLVSANTAPLRTQMLAASRDVAKFETAAEAANTRLSGMAGLAKAAGLATGVLLAVGLTKAVSAAVEFERGMRNANTIMQLSEEQFAAVSDEVLSLSRRVPQSANVLAAGLYNIASAGFAGAEGLEVLEKSAVAAAAGLTTTDVSAKAITSVLNAYGLEASSAADVSDVLFKTVELGVLTFEDLASQLGDVLGLGAAAEIQIDELAAATATMTKAGISTAQATTSLNRAIQSIIDPGDDFTALLRSWGYESGQAALDHLGLEGVIQRVREATGGQAQEVLKYFTEIRAARGVLALMIDDGRTYAEISAQITDEQSRAGATAAAFAEQQKALSAQWDLFVSGVESGLIVIGRELIPFLSDLLRITGELAGAVSGALGEAFRRLQPLLGSTGELFSALWSILSSVVDVAAPVAAVLAAVVAGPIIAGLTVMVDVLASVAGWLSDSEVALAALAAVAAVAAVPAISALVTRLQVFLVLGVANAVAGIATALTGAAGAAGVLQAAMGPLGIALAAASAAFVYLKARGSEAADSYMQVRDAAQLLADTDFDAPDSEGFLDTVREMRSVLAALGEDAARAYLIRVAIEDVETGTSPVEALSRVEEIARRVFGAGYEIGVSSADLLDLQVEISATGDQVSALADSINSEWGGLWHDLGDLAGETFRDIATEAAEEFASGNWQVALANLAAAEDAIRSMEIPAAASATALSDLSDEFAKQLGLQGFSLQNSNDMVSALRQVADGVTNVTDRERDYAAAIVESVDAGSTLVDAISDVSSEYPELAGATAEATAAQADQLAELAELEAQYIELHQALSDYLDEQRAMVDPVFAAQRASEALEEAHRDEADAVAALQDVLSRLNDENEDNRSTTEDVAEAERDLEAARRASIEAAVDQDAALAGLKVAVDEGRVSVDKAAAQLDRWVESGAISAEAAQLFRDDILELTGAANEFSDGVYTAEVEVEGTSVAAAAIDELKSKVSQLTGSVWSVVVDTVVSAPRQPGRTGITQADGGVVKYYASGGVESHVAQIAPAGSWRVWAEPETGGEAYIPLAPSKRARSMDILSEVANRFGVGGVTIAPGSFAPVINVSGGGADTATMVRSELELAWGEFVRERLAN